MKLTALTPPSLIDTFPLDTEKSSDTNEAIPFSDVEPSCTLTVTVLSVTAAVTPVQPANDRASFNKSTVSFPLEQLIDRLVARTVSPEPSPTNEPVRVDVQTESQK